MPPSARHRSGAHPATRPWRGFEGRVVSGAGRRRVLLSLRPAAVARPGRPGGRGGARRAAHNGAAPFARTPGGLAGRGAATYPARPARRTWSDAGQLAPAARGLPPIGGRRGRATRRVEPGGSTGRAGIRRHTAAVYDLRRLPWTSLASCPRSRQQVERFRREAGVETRFSAEPDLAIPAVVEVGVFRVVQEALLNVQKHARATHVDVRLEHNGEELLVR